MRFFRRFFCFCVGLMLCFGTVLPVSASSLDLYATWQVSVTFDANGGRLAGGADDAEKALAGRQTGSVTRNVNQPAATGLTGTWANHTFVEWNTEPDGSGTAIADYGAITGPVTFYAIYYQSYYVYAGQAQVFRVPVDGVYSFQLSGASGGQNGRGSQNTHAGYIEAAAHLTEGTVMYVMVGGNGSGGVVHPYSPTGGGWNGGGATWRGSAEQSVEGGGGATDIRMEIDDATTGANWTVGLESRILVAGGSGGTNAYTAGGNGGGWSGSAGGFGGTPGTQSSGYGFGRGANYGGGGYYGGNNGAGGSSYAAGWPDCAEGETYGITWENVRTVAGGGVDCYSGAYARITLVTQDGA